MTNNYLLNQKACFTRWLFCFLILIGFGVTNVNAQFPAQLLNPAGDGGFENGSTFAANGWTVVNFPTATSPVNEWVVGTSTLTGMTAPFSGNRAFVSSTLGANNNYNASSSNHIYLYRDIVVPAGATFTTVTFDWVCTGELTWDIIQVFVAPTSITPVAGLHPGSGNAVIPADITGATQIGFVP